MTTWQFFLINLGAFITSLGGIFLKRFSASDTIKSIDCNSIRQIILNSNLWLGGFCYVFPIFFWAYLLRSMELTKLQPLLSIVYIYTLVVSYIFLGEQPSIQRLVGIGIVMTGVIIIGRS